MAKAHESEIVALHVIGDVGILFPKNFKTIKKIFVPLAEKRQEEAVQVLNKAVDRGVEVASSVEDARCTVRVTA